MVERYLEQQEAIRNTPVPSGKKELIIPSEKNAVLKEIEGILEPFEAVKREMSSDKYTSASKVIPISNSLQGLMSVQKETIPRLITLHLIAEMKTIFLNIEETSYLRQPHY